MKIKLQNLFLIVLSFFYLILPGCKSSRQIYYFHNNASSFASTPPISDLTQQKEPINPGIKLRTVAFPSQKVPAPKPKFSEIITAENTTDNKTIALISSPLVSLNPIAAGNKIKASSKKQAKYRRQKAFADPSPEAYTAVLVGLLMFILTILAIIAGIATGWFLWYIIGLAFFILAIVLWDMIDNNKKHDTFDYIKTILGVTLIVTALGFGIHYLLILPTIYSVLALAAVILFFFIRKIVKYYRKKANATKK